MCNEVIHDILKNNLVVVSLKIDFRKAYDIVCWDFLKEILKAMGFPATFLKVIHQAITMGATSQMLINGTRGKPFPITRSIRQGCPLSPILFLFIVEALSIVTTKAQ